MSLFPHALCVVLQYKIRLLIRAELVSVVGDSSLTSPTQQVVLCNLYTPLHVPYVWGMTPPPPPPVMVLGYFLKQPSNHLIGSAALCCGLVNVSFTFGIQLHVICVQEVADACSVP